MLGHRKFDLHDYLRILRRRWWIIAIPTVIGPVLAYAATLVLPPRFVSTGLIFIDRPQVPEEVVKPMTTGDLIERINAIEEKVLSRSRLEPLLGKYGLVAKNEAVSEDAVDALRKAITIAPAQFTSGLTGNGREPVPGLSISCTSASALTAQEMCADVTSMFIGQSLEQVQQVQQGTTDFISAQLADAKRKLDDEDAKLADFKSRNLGRLPDDQETNLRVLMDHNAELESAAQALDRASQDRSYMQSLLQQQVGSWQSTGAPVSMAAGPDDLQTQLEKAQATLTELLAKYTPDYPDVTRQKKTIADLQKQIGDRSGSRKEAADSSSSKQPEKKAEPLQIQQLRAQIHQDDEIIRTRTDEQTRLKAQIAESEQKLQLSPVVEEQLKNLTRDHETALQFYNSLLGKKSQSEMEGALERREQGERFVLLDPPNLPVKPEFPKKSLFLPGGLGGGIALGLALALLLEALDNSIQDERDIEILLKVHNLANLPSVASLKGWSPNKKSRAGKPTITTILTLKN